MGLGRRVLGFGCNPKEAILAGQKWLPFLTTNLVILGGFASLERYLRGSREHLEGFGGLEGHLSSSKEAIFVGQGWLPPLTHKLGGSWGAWEGLERYLREHLERFGGVWKGM